MPIYKNGKYGYKVIISYTDEHGNHKQICRCNEHTRTKNDAKEYEVYLLNELKHNNTANNDITFSELYYAFKTDRRNELRNSTARKYEQDYNNHLKDYFGSMKIHKINRRDIINWKNKIDSEDLKLSTKKSIYKHFNCILNYAVNYYGLSENVLSKVGTFKSTLKQEEDVIHYWTFDQFKVFQHALEMECKFKHNETELRWWASYCAFNILYFAGLRKGEALALKWSDLVFINGQFYLDVNKSINQKQNPPEITAPKNKSSIRKVPVCDELLQILLEQKARFSDVYNFNEDLFYICGIIRPISDTAILEIKNYIVKKCELPNIRIHDFRHSYCSLLINGGLPLSVIASLLGHSNTDITQKVYTHIFPESNIKVLDFLNKLH